MSKLFLIGPKSRLEKIVAKLHDLKAAHIIEHKKGEFDICIPLGSLEKISSLLVQLRSLMSHLKIKEAESLKGDFKIAELEKNIELIKKEASEAIEKTKKTEDNIGLIDSQSKVLKLMSILNLSPEDFAKLRYIKSYFGYVNDPNLNEKLQSVSKNFEIYSVQQDKNFLIALFADIRHAEQFEKVLENASFSEIDTSVINGLSGNAKELIEVLSKKREKLESELAIQRNRLKRIVERHGSYLADTEKFLSIEAEKAQVPLSFGSTKEVFFLRCYIPKEDAEQIKKEIIKAADDKLYIAEEHVEEHEEVPSKLNNPKGLKSFEFFTNLYSLPKYDEFDPTFLMAFTFPLFFGFMLGDVGYGILTLALFYYLKKKYPAGKSFFNILIVSSIAAIIFGTIYGEVFGYELWHGIIVRTHDTNTLIIISIIAGIVQVNLGLLLGFILEYRHIGFLNAAYRKLSWILLQAAGFILYASYTKLISAPVYAGYSLLAAAVIMLIKGEGYMGVVEIPSLISHIVSYARLMAVGLASVFIAVMVNDLTTFLFHKGILFVPLAVISLVIGHLFNIALGIFSPSLHSIRLHYVEFFTKFYTGGGIEYAPFGAEKQKSIF